MDLKLANKAVLITGSSKGIGLAIAKTLAAEGCNVGICARNKDDLKAASDTLTGMGVKVFSAVVDVADGESIVAWIEGAAKEFGAIDGFVNNASAGGADVEESGWRENFEKDMLAAWKAMNAVKPHLIASKGSVVNISSTAALEAFAGAVPFGALKAGLLNYFGNLAQELAPAGVRVNSVSPGPVFIEGGAWDQIKTHMPEIYEGTLAAIPFGRMAKAEEVANQVALFLSPLAGFTTGTNIVIDGCFTKRIMY